MDRPHHRPLTPGAGFFDDIDAGGDPAQVHEAADRLARVLVRGRGGTEDPTLADRVAALAEGEGLEAMAELWSTAPPESLAGCLWRLYLLRTWVHASPDVAARDFDRGLRAAPVARVVAGVPEPPGPAQVRAMIDQVLRGITESEFADVLFRAAAFTRVVAAGRAADPDSPVGPAARMLQMSEQLEAAGHLELHQGLG